MKFRLTLIFAALVVMLGAMTVLMQNRPLDSNSPAIAAMPAAAVRVEAPAIEQGIAPPAVAAPAVVSAVAAAPAPQAQLSPMVHIDASGEMKYVARAGDTVSQLAIALRGSDTKEHRDAVIAADPSLQANPDRVLEGQAYYLNGPSAVHLAKAADARPQANAVAQKAEEDATAATPAPDEEAGSIAADGAKMKYTAQRGDTVSTLAANLLGGDTKANREGIVANNASLQQDPDRLVAGQSYTIVARNGLAANPDGVQKEAPTTQPDADDAARLSVGRTLQYTAQPGDTVSKLAIVLLGSDTAANRNSIINSNFSLKNDPDHLVAGQTYWISAPTADSAR